MTNCKICSNRKTQHITIGAARRDSIWNFHFKKSFTLNWTESEMSRIAAFTDSIDSKWFDSTNRLVKCRVMKESGLNPLSRGFDAIPPATYKSSFRARFKQHLNTQKLNSLLMNYAEMNRKRLSNYFGLSMHHGQKFIIFFEELEKYELLKHSAPGTKQRGRKKWLLASRAGCLLRGRFLTRQKAAAGERQRPRISRSSLDPSVGLRKGRLVGGKHLAQLGIVAKTRHNRL